MFSIDMNDASSLDASQFLLYSMEEEIDKGSHKYIKRVPTGQPKPKYRYYYKMPKGGLVSTKDLMVGSSFQHGSGDSRSHYKVTAVSGDKITVTHAGSGETRTATFAQLKDLLDNDRLQQADPKQQAAPEQQASSPSQASAKTPQQKQAPQRGFRGYQGNQGKQQGRQGGVQGSQRQGGFQQQKRMGHMRKGFLIVFEEDEA